MDVLCVNGKFSVDFIEFYKKYGVIVPIQDSIYTIRDVIINFDKGVGLLLEELVNPKVPIFHPLLQEWIEMEPNWDINRFATLSSNPLNIAEIKNLFKDVGVKQFNKTEIKSY